jgi:hypothetical protein
MEDLKVLEVKGIEIPEDIREFVDKNLIEDGYYSTALEKAIEVLDLKIRGAELRHEFLCYQKSTVVGFFKKLNEVVK